MGECCCYILCWALETWLIVLMVIFILDYRDRPKEPDVPLTPVQITCLFIGGLILATVLVIIVVKGACRVYTQETTATPKIVPNYGAVEV